MTVMELAHYDQISWLLREMESVNITQALLSLIWLLNQCVLSKWSLRSNKDPGSPKTPLALLLTTLVSAELFLSHSVHRNTPKATYDMVLKLQPLLHPHGHLPLLGPSRPSPPPPPTSPQDFCHPHIHHCNW